MKKIKIPYKIIILAFLVLIAGTILYMVISNNQKTQENLSPQQADESINYSPAGDEDKQRVADNKQEIVDKQNNQDTQNTPPNGISTTVKPIITYSGQYGDQVEVGGYIDVFEEGGTCTATLTQGNAVLSKKVSAVRGAKSVDCPAMIFAKSEFTNTGVYSLVLKYESPNYSGESDPKSIEIK